MGHDIIAALIHLSRNLHFAKIIWIQQFTVCLSDQDDNHACQEVKEYTNLHICFKHR